MKNKAKKYHFMCDECRTRYQSSQEEAPPGILWSDGHRCVPIRVPDDQTDNFLMKRRGEQCSDDYQVFI